MSNRYFPIKQSPACQLKWTWSSLRFHEGTTSSCHRVEKEFITPQNFQDFHNTPLKIKDRELMLSGQWPGRGCEYCKHIEDAGGTSDRLHHLTIPNLTPPELDIDTFATHVTPRIIEVHFSNLCNLKCLYCRDSDSSRIQNENKRHGRFESNGVVIDNQIVPSSNSEQLIEQFWEYMEKNKSTVKRLNFLGGEPFYQKHLVDMIDWLEKTPCPDMELNIISNLNVEHNKFVGFIDRFYSLLKNRCLRRFDLTCSIDCLGKDQEYVRFGLDLNTFKKNFEYVVGKKWIYLNFNQTISTLTVKTSADLLEYVNLLRTRRTINHHFGIAIKTHSFLHPQVLGDYFTEDFDRIIGLMQNTTTQEKVAVEYMTSIKNQVIAHTVNYAEVKKLIIYLNEMDRRRSTNWQATFPWLTKLAESVE